MDSGDTHILFAHAISVIWPHGDLIVFWSKIACKMEKKETEYPHPNFNCVLS